jgi:hypothetical protein
VREKPWKTAGEIPEILLTTRSSVDGRSPRNIESHLERQDGEPPNRYPETWSQNAADGQISGPRRGSATLSHAPSHAIGASKASAATQPALTPATSLDEEAAGKWCRGAQVPNHHEAPWKLDDESTAYYF